MQSALIGKTSINFFGQFWGKTLAWQKGPQSRGRLLGSKLPQAGVTGCLQCRPAWERMMLMVTESLALLWAGPRVLHHAARRCCSLEPASRKAVPRSGTWWKNFPLALVLPASTMLSARRFIKSCLYQWSGPTHGVGLGEASLGQSFSKCWKNKKKRRWWKPTLDWNPPLACFGWWRGSRGREWAHVNEALPNRPPYAYFILSFIKVLWASGLGPKIFSIEAFFF